MSTSANARKKPAANPSVRRLTTAKVAARENRKERVLIEFPVALLQRADEAARGLETNRSGLVRNAVERLLNEMESEKIDRELAAGYMANGELSRKLCEEFEAIDREGF